MRFWKSRAFANIFEIINLYIQVIFYSQISNTYLSPKFEDKFSVESQKFFVKGQKLINEPASSKINISSLLIKP